MLPKNRHNYYYNVSYDFLNFSYVKIVVIKPQSKLASAQGADKISVCGDPSGTKPTGGRWLYIAILW